MLKDAKAHRFDVVVLHDLSRLSRDTIETAQACRRFVFWKIRLVTTDGIDTAQEGWEELAGIRSVINHQYNKSLAKNIKRGMVGQAHKAYWNGGRVYGYRLTEEFHPTHLNKYDKPLRLGTKLVIDEAEAEVIRWIFREYANGVSPLKIVTQLNEQGIRPPGAVYQRRRSPHTPTWSFVSLHGDLSRGTGLLNNTLYRGVYIWNRSWKEKDPDTDVKVNRWRDRSEWIEKPVPELRIVSEDLWEQVHARRVAVSQSVEALRASKQCRLTSTGRRPKYLLSGVLRCAECQSPMVMHGATQYACSVRRTRGATSNTCTNSVTVDRKLAEAIILDQVKQRLFTEEGFAIFQNKFEAAAAVYRQRQKPDREQAKARLVEIKQEIARLVQV
jgi:site-specific DNA recombinase